MFFSLFLSCQSPIELHSPVYSIEEKGISLDTPLLLRRISLDIRGNLPSIEELERLSTEHVSILIDEMLESSAHEEQLISLFNHWLKTKVDTFNLTEQDYHLSANQAYPLIRSVGEEPLRFMAHIASQDISWLEVVRADYTMSNDLLLNMWPLEAIDSNDGWFRAQYTDGRPAGGILMTNGLWWRYYTTPNNFSRSRAMMLSELFLCENYLHRPIKFQAPALLERESLNEFIRTEPACIGCHSTLDPLAAALFGFWWYDLYDTAELSYYHIDREPLGSYYLEQEPAWFGTPIKAPIELGIYLSQDRRFTQCTVQQTVSFLLQRSVDNADFSLVQKFHEEFQASDWRFSALLKSIVQSNEYQAGAPIDPQNISLTTRRLLSVEQLQNVILQIAGLRWEKNGYDQFQNDIYGYRTLLGGIDGINTKERAKNPSLTQQLVIKRLSQAIAQHLVTEHWEGNDVPLFRGISLADVQAEDTDFITLHTHIHRTLFSRAPTEERLHLDQEYFAQIAQQHSVQEAWISLLSVTIRDPDFWTY